MIDRIGALDEFYELLAELERRCGGKRRLAECDGRSGWPTRGVYFFFEDGETRAGDKTLRVTRVGTHALRASSTTLWKRLRQHRGSAEGTKIGSGGGNHRGSVFRLHVGTALLASGQWSGEIRDSWAVGGNAPAETKQAEVPLERAVSQRIGSMPFLWLDVDDEPSSASDRGVIERGSIALLSNHARDSIDPPTSDWLGAKADRDLVKSSGLWNVNHVQDQPSAEFLATLRRHVLAHQ